MYTFTPTTLIAAGEALTIDLSAAPQPISRLNFSLTGTSDTAVVIGEAKLTGDSDEEWRSIALRDLRTQSDIPGGNITLTDNVARTFQAIDVLGFHSVRLKVVSATAIAMICKAAGIEAAFDPGGVAPQNVAIADTPQVITDDSAAALSVGPNGDTNPILRVKADVASAATGVEITGNAAGAGATFQVLSSGTDESLLLKAKGTGIVQSPDGIKSTSPTDGMGYGTGAGGTVTQGTSRTTTVVLNKVSGNIVLFSAAGSATPFSFTLTNSAIAAGDTVIINQKSGTDKYTTQVVTAVAAGSCQITLANAAGTTTEQPVFNFNVIKGVAA